MANSQVSQFVAYKKGYAASQTSSNACPYTETLLIKAWVEGYQSGGGKGYSLPQSVNNCTFEII